MMDQSGPTGHFDPSDRSYPLRCTEAREVPRGALDGMDISKAPETILRQPEDPQNPQNLRGSGGALPICHFSVAGVKSSCQ